MDQTRTYSVLVVEDEYDLRQMLLDVLHGAAFTNVIGAANCYEARTAFLTQHPQAVILDINLPDGDGFSLMQEMRQTSNIPTLFLSARDADADRLHGLGLGADDYITKPFLPDELILRLTAILNRTYHLTANPPILTLGPVQINWASGMVHHPNRPDVALTAKETALLHKLADERGNIVTIDALCQAAWQDGIFGYENTLMVHIRRLREKIELDPSKPVWLRTIRGLGYKLERES
ncbi:MAG: response regulator transcription factor [Butyricicoccus pullicaecorum]|nr:response regulator transcription factor [Butyricicoccus pullicaecorum]